MRLSPIGSMKRKKPLKIGSCVVFGFLGLFLVGLMIYIGLVGIGAILIVADPLEPVDAVVVLSGDDGDRLALALEMHDKGMAPNLVITDTSREANRRLVREAEQGGFPEDAIYITNLRVENTLDEARAVRELSQSQGWDALMVVTDPFHSFRARFIFRRELQGSGVIILVRPVVGHWFRSPSWFFHREGWGVVFLEIAKFSSYLFLGR